MAVCRRHSDIILLSPSCIVKQTTTTSYHFLLLKPPRPVKQSPRSLLARGRESLCPSQLIIGKQNYHFKIPSSSNTIYRLKSIWGEDADVWRAERFLEGVESNHKAGIGMMANLCA